MEILSYRNCHRAEEVRPVAGGDTVRFKFLAKRIDRKRVHMAGDAEVADNDNELSRFEVVKWAIPESLEELWDMAVRSYSGVSFSPEDRARQSIMEFEDALHDDLQEIAEERREEYREAFISKVRDLYHRKAAIVSPMITGPARFPVERNRKRCEAYDKAFSAFMTWRENMLKAEKKRKEQGKSEEQKRDEAWESLREEIDICADTIKDIDSGKNRYTNRSLIVSNLYGKLERIAAKGDGATIEQALGYIKAMEMPKPIFTDRHRVWKLPEEAGKASERLKAEQDKYSRIKEISGVKVVKNFAEARLQLIFDGKPDPETISNLKHNGFRWSPRFGTWQRQLTSNANYGAARVLGVDAKELLF